MVLNGLKWFEMALNQGVCNLELSRNFIEAGKNLEKTLLELFSEDLPGYRILSSSQDIIELFEYL